MLRRAVVFALLLTAGMLAGSTRPSSAQIPGYDQIQQRSIHNLYSKQEQIL
jgi:hypothetical protein